VSPGWRPLPGPPPDRGPRPVRESLDRLAAGLGGGRGDSASLAALFTRWEEAVGGDVAAHARPLSLRDGRLVVGADDPAWAAQLRWLEAHLLRRLGDLLGPDVVTAVDVRVRPPDRPR
jgi:predicted nucleic acid-binding Zn ribbon protein